jgi:hypothetical protein
MHLHMCLNNAIRPVLLVRMTSAATTCIVCYETYLEPPIEVGAVGARCIYNCPYGCNCAPPVCPECQRKTSYNHYAQLLEGSDWSSDHGSENVAQVVAEDTGERQCGRWATCGNVMILGCVLILYGSWGYFVLDHSQ